MPLQENHLPYATAFEWRHVANRVVACLGMTRMERGHATDGGSINRKQVATAVPTYLARGEESERVRRGGVNEGIEGTSSARK